MNNICPTCHKSYETKDKRSKYCSRSCSAKMNGVLYPKRKRIKKCRGCSGYATSGRTFCEKCTSEGKHQRMGSFIEDRTLEEEQGLKAHKGANRYDHIRSHASRVMKGEPKICKVCNYSKHAEICHIKAISDFLPSDKILKINDKNNLIYLCRNCHWEFDHGMLKMVDNPGLEPGTQGLLRTSQ